eukprot:GFYU01009109.1.p1 GENE.GFYU01009109.1~~GFYU01009109.1.p1  ORF type:complete len:213 (-),score=21.33 GFYU01009109.1:93-731(-)
MAKGERPAGPEGQPDVFANPIGMHPNVASTTQGIALALYRSLLLRIALAKMRRQQAANRERNQRAVSFQRGRLFRRVMNGWRAAHSNLVQTHERNHTATQHYTRTVRVKAFQHWMKNASSISETSSDTRTALRLNPLGVSLPSFAAPACPQGTPEECPDSPRKAFDYWSKYLSQHKAMKAKVTHAQQSFEDKLLMRILRNWRVAMTDSLSAL